MAGSRMAGQGQTGRCEAEGAWCSASEKGQPGRRAQALAKADAPVGRLAAWWAGRPAEVQWAGMQKRGLRRRGPPPVAPHPSLSPPGPSGTPLRRASQPRCTAARSGAAGGRPTAGLRHLRVPRGGGPGGGGAGAAHGWAARQGQLVRGLLVSRAEPSGRTSPSPADAAPRGQHRQARWSSWPGGRTKQALQQPPSLPHNETESARGRLHCSAPDLQDSSARYSS